MPKYEGVAARTDFFLVVVVLVLVIIVVVTVVVTSLSPSSAARGLFNLCHALAPKLSMQLGQEPIVVEL
jgi:uncharacterized membrane protein YhaH (DUF805 family)